MSTFYANELIGVGPEVAAAGIAICAERSRDGPRRPQPDLAARGRPTSISWGGPEVSPGASRGRLVMRRIAVNHMFGKGRDPAFRTADDGLSDTNLLSPRARTS